MSGYISVPSAHNQQYVSVAVASIGSIVLINNPMLFAHLTMQRDYCAAASAAAPAHEWPGGASQGANHPAQAAALAAMMPQPMLLLQGPTCGWAA
jgi:hypothetical protein